MQMQPSEGLALSWRDYHGTLAMFIADSTPDGEEEADAPDPAFVASHLAAAEKAGLVRTLH